MEFYYLNLFILISSAILFETSAPSVAKLDLARTRSTLHFSSGAFVHEIRRNKELHLCTLFIVSETDFPLLDPNQNRKSKYQGSDNTNDLLHGTAGPATATSTELFSLSDKIIWSENPSTLASLPLAKNPVKRLKRLGGNCIVSILDISQSKSKMPADLVPPFIYDFLNLFTKFRKGSSPLTKKNEDFYIFIVHSNAQARAALSSELISYKLRYKLSIQEAHPAPKTIPSASRRSSVSGAPAFTTIQRGHLRHLDCEYIKHLIVSTYCFYCAKGKGQVLTINLKQFLVLHRSSLADISTPEAGPMAGEASCKLWRPKFNVLFPDYLRNFKGREIRISTINSGGALNVKKIRNADRNREEFYPIRRGGCYLQNIVSAAEKLNFTYWLKPTEGTGLKYPNGTWNGVVGDILAGTTDIGAVAGLTLGRFGLVEVTSAHEFLIVGFTHAPTEPIQTYKFVIWPFSMDLWTTIILATVIAIIFLYGTYNFQVHVNNVVDPPKTWSLTEILLAVFPSFVLQCPVHPRNAPQRLFWGFWLLFIIVIVTAYSSKMFTLFVYPPMERSPSTFPELAGSEYTIRMAYFGGAIYQWFKIAPKNSSYGLIYKRWEKRRATPCFQEAMEKKVACISYNVNYGNEQARLGDPHGRWQMIWKHADAFSIPIGIPTEYRSIFLNKFNRIMSSNFESGRASIWRRETNMDVKLESRDSLKSKNVTKSNNVAYVVSHDPVRLTIGHFKGAFTILWFGCFLSVTGHSLELIVFYRSWLRQLCSNKRVI